MKLEGTYTVPAPRDLVWQHLMNPQTLARALPGCEKMEQNADGSFGAELKVGIGAVKGTYQGRVEILDPAPPERFRMKVEAKGSGGFAKAKPRSRSRRTPAAPRSPTRAKRKSEGSSPASASG